MLNVTAAGLHCSERVNDCDQNKMLCKTELLDHC